MLAIAALALAGCAEGAPPSDARVRPDVTFGGDTGNVDDFDAEVFPDDFTEAVDGATQVDAGPCAEQPFAECTPGDSRQGSCDPCSRQTCGTDCIWSECRIKPTSECEYRGGSNYRSCSGCRCGRQWCQSSCKWGTSCISCCSGCGGCL